MRHEEPAIVALVNGKLRVLIPQGEPPPPRPTRQPTRPHQ